MAFERIIIEIKQPIMANPIAFRFINCMIENTSSDARISFMRGDTPLTQMQEMIAKGDCDCVFVLPANSFAQVEAVADQNLTMPPKSTWVEPKLLTGLVSQYFD